MAKHNCLLYGTINGRCIYCNRPRRTLNKKSPFKIGDIVTLPRSFTYGRRKFKIIIRFLDNSYQLQFQGGKEKGEVLERFDWWDLLKFKKRNN